MTTQEILEAARAAKTAVALSDGATRNAALGGMADALGTPEHLDAILAANAEDMAAAKGKISDVMLDRLALTPQRIAAMAKGIRDVAALPDPVGRVLSRIQRPNGLLIEKTAVPMGVIAIIYESRPNVTSDAAALAIKSGNACILRCGKEAWRSANAIVAALRQEEVKRMIAYSSSAQISYIFLALGLGSEAGWTAACYQILAHAMTKSMIFVGAGEMIRASGGHYWGELRGAARLAPLGGAAFTVGGLSLCGLPLLAGFSAKYCIAAAALDAEWQTAPHPVWRRGRLRREEDPPEINGAERMWNLMEGRSRHRDTQERCHEREAAEPEPGGSGSPGRV